VGFAEDAGEALPGGELEDRCLCCGRLVGHTVSVWRRLLWREVVRKAWRQGEQRTAAVAAIDAIAGDGVGAGVGFRVLVRDLQDLLRQVPHLDLI
jgi:hypothetical protein